MSLNLNLYHILKNVLSESIDKQSVEDAIQTKNVVMITYNDDKPNAPLGKRWIEPCSLVDMNGAGKLAIRAYAYNGATRRGEIPDWRLFRLDRIVSWNPTTSHFTQPPDNRYNENGDSQYTVLKQVVFDKNDSMIQRNINLSNQDNLKQNRDYFGRLIDKTRKQKNIAVPQNNQGPVNSPMPQKSYSQSGPIDNKQKAFKYAKDLQAKRNQRDQERYNKNLQQNFSDDEDEVLDKFDNEKLF